MHSLAKILHFVTSVQSRNCIYAKIRKPYSKKEVTTWRPTGGRGGHPEAFKVILKLSIGHLGASEPSLESI